MRSLPTSTSSINTMTSPIMALSVAVAMTSNAGGTTAPPGASMSSVGAIVSRSRRPMNVLSRAYEFVEPLVQKQACGICGEVPQPTVWSTNALVLESAIRTYDMRSVDSRSCSSAIRWPTSCAIVAHSSSSRRGTFLWVSEKLNAMPRSVTLQKLSADAIPNSSFAAKPASWPVPPTLASMKVPLVGLVSTIWTLNLMKCFRTHAEMVGQLKVLVLSGGIENVGPPLPGTISLFTRPADASVEEPIEYVPPFLLRKTVRSPTAG